MVREIFISYSRKDFDKAKAIKAEIEKATGAECWMDLSSIESGDPSFVDAIARGISDCKIFLFLLSIYSQNSRYAIGEMELARKLHKKNILINIDNCSLSPSFFLLYSHSNIRHWIVPNEKEQLLSDLKMWLNVEEKSSHGSTIVDTKSNPQAIYKQKNTYFLQQALTRYKLRKMIEARREKPSIVVCSEPQKGASQIICNFLQNKGNHSNVQISSGSLCFPRGPISPFDGLDNGIACRFSTIRGNQKLPSPIKARLLTIPKLAEWICISYYQNVTDIKNYSEEELSNIKSYLKKYKSLPEQPDALITDEDIAGIKDQILRQQKYCLILSEVQILLDDIASIARFIPKDDLTNVFSCMWHFDSILTTFFKRMIIALEKLNFSKETYLPINVIDNDIKEISCVLSYKCFSYLEEPKNDTKTDVFLSSESGIATIERFSMAELSALMTEVVLFIDEEMIINDVFKKADLIRLSSLRVSSCIQQSQIAENLSSMLARSKGRLIYDDYMDSLSMNVLIFCHDQHSPSNTWSLMLQDWVNAYVGQTPSMRASMLNHTNGISPLFIVSTKFHQDVMMTNGESLENNKALEYMWIERFERILFKDVLEGDSMEWVTNWTHLEEYFNNVYLLGSQEKCHLPQSCFEQLRTSFINNSIVCRFFNNPAKAWDIVTTKNDDGTLYIIDKLSQIIPAIERLRDEQLLNSIVQLTESINK